MGDFLSFAVVLTTNFPFITAFINFFLACLLSYTPSVYFLAFSFLLFYPASIIFLGAFEKLRKKTISFVSGVPRNFVSGCGGGGGSTNSVEDRENGDLVSVAP